MRIKVIHEFVCPHFLNFLTNQIEKNETLKIHKKKKEEVKNQIETQQLMFYVHLPCNYQPFIPTSILIFKKIKFYSFKSINVIAKNGGEFF